MLLIYPPVAKPSEPPAGIARLAGALAAYGVPCLLLDANIEGLLYLLQQPGQATDTWTSRALRNLPGNIAALREQRTYRSRDRYARAVRDLQRVLAMAARPSDAVLGLADYRHHELSPVRSADLLKAAANPERNPFYPYFRERLPGLLARVRTGRIGISLNYLSQALSAFAMIGHIRREFPRFKIILGGGLVTSWMQGQGWRNPFGGLVDHLIAGPGEEALLGLIVIGDRAPIKPIKQPDYGPLPLADYLSPGFILPYSAASGCYWSRCSFCPERAEGNPYRPLPIGQVRVELAGLIEKTKPLLLHLLDNAVSPALLRSLADDPPGVPWYGFARISRDLADEGFCRALRRSGCALLKLGLESGDQGVLDALGKGIEISTASRVLRSLQKAGIAVYLYLLFGAPAETLDSARRTLDFVAEHGEAIHFLNLAVFNMPLWGPEAAEYESSEFYAGDLSLYTGFRHPCGWNRREVRRFLDQEFRRHTVVSRLLKNDPPVFTSSHAAFFV